MPSLSSDRTNPTSPTSTLKSGKRQSRRREAILDAFRLLHHHSHSENEGGVREERKRQAEEPEDAISLFNNFNMESSTRGSKSQSHHSRSKSNFFLGSSHKKQNIPLDGAEAFVDGKEKQGRARAETYSHKALEQISDLVCLKAEQGASMNAIEWDRTDELWNHKKAQMERNEREEELYSALYSQVLLPSNVSSQRQRTNTTITAISSIKDSLEAKGKSTSTCETHGIPSPLPPKRLNRRRRAQSTTGCLNEAHSKTRFNDDAMVLKSQSDQSHLNHFSRIEAMVGRIAQPNQQGTLSSSSQPHSFGIVSESSHAFQSLSILPPRRVEETSSTIEPVIQRRKASLSSSGGGSCRSLNGSPDSFTSASSQWAVGSCHSGATTLTQGTRSRSSSICSSSNNTSSDFKSSVSKVVEEEKYPLPPIPARFLIRNTGGGIDNNVDSHDEIVNTPTFGVSLPLQTNLTNSPSMQSSVTNATSIYDVFPACITGVERISANVQSSTLPRPRVRSSLRSEEPEVFLSARSSSRPEGMGYGLGLSHVKLALAKDIRPLRRDTSL